MPKGGGSRRAPEGGGCKERARLKAAAAESARARRRRSHVLARQTSAERSPGTVKKNLASLQNGFFDVVGLLHDLGDTGSCFDIVLAGF